ncbi:MAG: methyltransferase [Micromonosporaceae bacterium]|nr:methyltransferase [Micromonosporaceae bacterium]
MLRSMAELELMAQNPMFRDRVLAKALRVVDYVPERVARILEAPSIRDVLCDSARYSFYFGHSRDLLRRPAAVLTQLFLLNGAAPADVFTRALPRALQVILREAALVRDAGDSVVSDFSLCPYQNRYFLSDQIFVNEGPGKPLVFAADSVMPPHASTFACLDGFAPDEGGDLVDLGCGSGALGVMWRKSEGRVLGIDIVDRAVAFSRLNAVLNGVTADYTSVDAREVTVSTRHHRLLFNAPTLPTRGANGGAGGMSARDAVRLAADAARRLLRPGGRAQVFCLVEAPSEGPTPTALVRRWLANQPVDVRVEPMQSRFFEVTREDVARGRLAPESLLAPGAAAGQVLLDHLRSASIAAIQPVVATVTV